MTQSEAEATLFAGCVKYTQFLSEMFNTGKAQSEALKNFYRQSNGALLLADRRVKKMYNDTVELNRHIEKYILNATDELKPIQIELDELIAKIADNP